MAVSVLGGCACVCVWGAGGKLKENFLSKYFAKIQVDQSKHIRKMWVGF